MKYSGMSKKLKHLIFCGSAAFQNYFIGRVNIF